MSNPSPSVPSSSQTNEPPQPATPTKAEPANGEQASEAPQAPAGAADSVTDRPSETEPIESASDTALVTTQKQTDGAETSAALVAEAERTFRRVDKDVSLFHTVVRWYAVLFVFSWMITQWVLAFLQLRRLYFLVARKPYEKLNKSRQLRLAFERLGPTYIKFGQIIASSEGLFPRKLSLEFRKCLDSVPPFPSKDALAIVEKEFGRPVDELYKSFDREPIAAASIAQVHFCTLLDGTEAVVKVQRPKLRRRVAADIRIMLIWAWLLEKVSLRMRLANIKGIINDFAHTLSEEMDFRLEARNMDEFNVLQRKTNSRACAPIVYWESTSRKILTMERFHGWRVDDPEIIEQLENPEEYLVEGLVAWFRCILEGDFFHGDVHAGNLMFLKDTRIGFIDFGIIGRLDDDRRKQAMGFMISIATRNYLQLGELVIEMGSVLDPTKIDRQELAEDLEKAYGPLVNMTMSELNYQQLIPQIMRMSVKHRLKFPQEFVLITKQLLYFDRYARLLAPNLNLFLDPRIFGLLITALPEFAGDNAGLLMGAATGMMAK